MRNSSLNFEQLFVVSVTVSVDLSAISNNMKPNRFQIRPVKIRNQTYFVCAQSDGGVIFIFYFFLFSFTSRLSRLFQYETGQSVGGAKTGETREKKHLAHPQAELGLSHMWPGRGSNPHQTQR